ncbi:HAMP domain-containing histidine kinase [Aminipila butyrica]|uniref:Heme sensor protein HssS n=2 Tax=Aminipila butyrica TaxID=433296 RepID=A0A858BZV2_9FIRM|nr:HAMP domain-containing sensor histidine kinase [Aminipila butyrica]QIB70799.1 HAMP domain-containing histidine kinase [Aminipila butyrica]
MAKKALTFMLSLLVFIILLLTMCIISVAIILLYRYGVLKEITEPAIVGPILLLIISSILIGTILTGILSKIPLRPIRKVVAACNQVADGDFSIRLPLSPIDEFNVFSKSFNRMVEELGSLEILRSDFVNNFSHEFKTPIVSLRGFAKILKYSDLTEEERNEYLDIIISESNRLAELSTNVLTLTALENLNIISSKEDFDLSEQVRRSVLLLESKWSNKSLELIIDLDDLTYNGNEDLLNQVWINLIDNAIKFSPDKGKIKIKLKSLGDRVMFTVMDNGYGMDDESQKHIFDKFYQGDLSHSTEGNGLGLAIVNKIVKLHQGEITMESEPGIGTNFSVVLPV